MQIWKFKANQAVNELQVPQGARALSAGVQDGVVYVWFEVDPSAPAVHRFVRLLGTDWNYGTGEGYKREPDMTFIGTVQVGPFVWHVFDAGEL